MQSFEKHYANDPAKAKARDLYKKFIEETLLTFKNPKNLRVLCFPGIDGTEVIQVYDTLGIPRENIVGLERDENLVDRVQAAVPGVNVQYDTYENYVTSNVRLPFDIISTDYIGPISQAQLDANVKIVEKQPPNQFIFHTVNLKRRDHRAEDIYAAGHSLGRSRTELINGKYAGPDVKKRHISNIAELLDQFKTRAKNKKIREEDKSYSYSKQIKDSLYAFSCDEAERVFRTIFGSEYTKIVNEYLGFIKNIVETEIDPSVNPLEHLKAFPIAFEDLLVTSIFQINDSLASKGCTPNRAAYFFEILSEGVVELPKKNFKLLKSRRYKYTSDTGSPMLGDMMYFNYDQIQHDAARLIVSPFHKMICGLPYDDKSLTQNLRTYIKRKRRIQEWFKDNNTNIGDEESAPIRPEFPERIDLGGKAKPRLTKKRAMKHFDEGLTTNDIRELYPSSPKLNSVPAWKAWHSRQSNNNDTQKEKTKASISLEDIIVGNLTRGNILELLESSTSTEIANAFGVPLGPVRSIAAHKTMGRYNHLLTKS